MPDNPILTPAIVDAATGSGHRTSSRISSSEPAMAKAACRRTSAAGYNAKSASTLQGATPNGRPRKSDVALPRPGGDAWLSIERDSGAVSYEVTDRGWIAISMILHKGRHPARRGAGSSICLRRSRSFLLSHRSVAAATSCQAPDRRHGLSSARAGGHSNVAPLFLFIHS